MALVTLLVAIAALVVAIMAFHRSSGIHDLHHQLDELSSQNDQITKSSEDIMAHALSRLENVSRGQREHSSEDYPPATSFPIWTAEKS